jgi:hypothetical protein
MVRDTAKGDIPPNELLRGLPAREGLRIVWGSTKGRGGWANVPKLPGNPWRKCHKPGYWAYFTDAELMAKAKGRKTAETEPKGRARGARLASEGWFQISRKYRSIARITPGFTLLEAWEEAADKRGGNAAVHVRRYHESHGGILDGKHFASVYGGYEDIESAQHMTLSPAEFAGFRERGST